MSDERSEGLQGGEGDPGPENFLDSFDQMIGSLPPGDPVRRELLQLRPQILEREQRFVGDDPEHRVGCCGPCAASIEREMSNTRSGNRLLL